MTNESVLKKATMYSVLLMLFVIFFSIVLQIQKDNVSFAHDKNTIISEESTKNHQENVENTGENDEFLSDEWKTVLDENDGNVMKKLKEKSIAITKPSGLLDDINLSVEEIAVDSTIVLTLTSSMQFTLEQDKISWMNQGKQFSLSNIGNESNASYDPVKSYQITYGNVEASKEHSAQITFLLDTTYAYKIYEDKENFYVVLLKPQEVYDKIVVIDAGHGGIDGGTYSSGFKHLEKDMNLSILLYLKEYLDQTDIKVYYTRTTDVKIPLSQRVGLANAVDADLFLSIHCNSSEDVGTEGIEILYNEKQNELNSFRSIDLATICLEEINQIINRNNRGIVPRSKNVQIIGDSNVPVALVEVGFMTSTNDLNYLLTESNRKLVAKGIYGSIVRALEEIGSAVIN